MKFVRVSIFFILFLMFAIQTFTPVAEHYVRQYASTHYKPNQNFQFNFGIPHKYWTDLYEFQENLRKKTNEKE